MTRQRNHSITKAIVALAMAVAGLGAFAASAFAGPQSVTSHASVVWLGVVGSVDAGARMMTPRTVTSAVFPLIAM